MTKGVLVTRPLEQGEILCQLITLKGGFAYGFPTIAFEPITPTLSVPTAKAGLKPVILVVTSYQAFEHASPLVLSQLRRLVEANQLTLIAVGNATAQGALTYHLGVQVVAPRGATSEWLLAHPLLRAVEGRVCMILTGEQGRDLLPRTLVKRGAEVLLFEVYRRVCPKLKKPIDWARLQSQLQVVIATSFQGLVNTFALIPATEHPWLQGCEWIVPSERVKRLAHKKFALALRQIHVSEGASHMEILKVLDAIDPK